LLKTLGVTIATLLGVKWRYRSVRTNMTIVGIRGLAETAL